MICKENQLRNVRYPDTFSSPCSFFQSIFYKIPNLESSYRHSIQRAIENVTAKSAVANHVIHLTVTSKLKQN